jgi:WD40 repeat protein
MTASTPAAPGRIFISYRREDTAFPAGWLFDRLAGQFGENQIFKDVDSIQLGDDFVEVITTAVGSCDVLLALIGDRWLAITDEQGRRRLDNPDDFVRLEIETALARDIRVIPVLVGGARMPQAHQLPASLARLGRRNALNLSPDRFSSDIDPLLKVLERTLAEVKAGGDLAQEAGLAPQPHPVSLQEETRLPRASRERTGSLLARMEHGGSVTEVAFSPDGTLLATGSLDATARLWQTGTGREVARLKHGSELRAVAFSPDGTLLATGSLDATARLWQTAAGREVARMEHGSEVPAVAFSPDGTLLATGSDLAARLWQVATGRQVAGMELDRNHGSFVTTVAFIPDGTMLATGSARTVWLWDANTGRELARMEHDDWLWALAFSPDGTLLATGCQDNKAWLWETATGRELAHMEHGDWLDAVAFSPDGALLATGSDDKTARLWETATGREVARLEHGDGVAAVAFSPDGALLATGSVDATARLWAA